MKVDLLHYALIVFQTVLFIIISPYEIRSLLNIKWIVYTFVLNKTFLEKKFKIFLADCAKIDIENPIEKSFGIFFYFSS